MQGAEDRLDDGSWALALPYLLGLAGIFAAITWYTWALWGDALVDFGGALHRAERIADGAVLYRDVLSHYPPIAPYFMGGVLALFGKHLNVLYVTGLAVLLLESALLWYVGRRFLTRLETSLAMTSFWILLAFKPGLFNWVLPNVFANTFACLFATAVIATIVWDITRQSDARLILASLLVGITGLTKVEYGGAAYGALVFYVLFVRSPRSGVEGRGLRERLADLLRVSLPGGTLALLAIGLIVLEVPLNEVLFDNVYRTRSFSQVLDAYLESLFPPLPVELGRALLAYGLGFTGAALLIVFGLRRRESGIVRFMTALLAILLAGGVVYVVTWYVASELRMSPHDAAIEGVMLQFTWFPTAALALAFAALLLRERLGAPQVWRTLSIVATFAFLVTLRWNFRLAWAPFYGVFAPFLLVWAVASLLVRLTRRSWEVDFALTVVFGVWLALGAWVYRIDYLYREIPIESPRGVLYQPIWNAAPIRQIVRYLSPRLQPGQYVAVIPEEQFINFVLGAPHPTRDTGIGPGWLATPEDKERFLDEVLSRDTPYLVLSGRQYAEFGAGTLSEYEPELVRRLLQHYRVVRSARGRDSLLFLIFERIDDSSPGSPGAAEQAS